MAEAVYVQKFEDFLNSKYKRELEKVAEFFPEKKSLNIDYRLLEEHDIELADELIQKPAVIITAAEEAVKSMGIISSKEEVITPYVRFFNLPSDHNIIIRNVNSSHLNNFIAVEGVVTKITEVKPKLINAVFECSHCGRVYQIPQTDRSGKLIEPGSCSCERRSFQLLADQSDFIDTQKMEIQEPIELTKGGEQTRKIAVILEDDLTNLIAPGEKVIVTGVLMLQPPKYKKAVYDMFLEANHTIKLEKEFEELELTEEEEKEIKELSNDPKLYEKIVASIAPSIYGHNEIKEAIALQLFGGTYNKVKADGMKIRPDMHILLIGDPGCLIGDERVVLGNGAIVKMQDFGTEHLEEINQQILTGQGYKRDTATVFHSYKQQPVMEIITETGKSIKGTYNHPLLTVNGRQRKWKRLDELKVGEKLAAVPWIPCTITAPVKTNWKKKKRQYGPKPKSTMPKEVNKSLSGLMGYILGDGWIRKHRVCMLVHPDEKDIVVNLVDSIKKNFSLIPSVRKVKPKKGRTVELIEIDINDADVADNFSFLKEKRAPDLIMRSGNMFVSEFLAYLFEADGCVFSKGRGRRAVQLKSSEIELLRDVQMLLLRFGIHSIIVEGNLQVRRTESINKFYVSIGFKSTKKKQKLEKLVEDCKKLSKQQLRGKQLSEKIVSIKKAGITDVFDIEVPGSKRFIANGIVSHNTAKTQLLHYVKQLAPKGIYVSGKSSSAAGLTATAEKDDFGEGGWTLKAGALVLASGGMAMIDEFDKMGEEDRSSMHEAMETQQIHVAKAGIIATFKANASILAAANPKYGRFDAYELPANQFNIPPTIMSRFDLIFPIRDVLDEKRDTELADHILTSHFTSAMRLNSEFSKEEISEKEQRVLPVIDPALLRNYIAYARKNHSPVLTNAAINKIKTFYLDLRKMGEKQGSIPITARYLEGIVRLAEASAKGRLSDSVELEDAERAVKLLRHSLKEIGMDPETGQIDIDIIATGTSKSRVDKVRKVMSIIKTLNEKLGEAKHEDIIEEAKVQGLKIEDTEEMITQLKREGDIYSPKYGSYKPTEEKR